jgi:simple sugar transport system permease protein
MNDIIGLLGPGIVLAAPILYAAMGGMFSDRSGIFNIALEGFMLISAYFSVYGAVATHSLLLGTLIGVGSAGLASVVMGVVVVTFRAYDVIVGIAINVFAVGLTTFLLSQHQSGGAALKLSSGYPGLHIGVLDGIPVLNELFNNRDIVVWMMIPLVVGTYITFKKTSFGLQLKAVGEAPLAAQAAGVRVSAVRFLSIVVSGVLCGFGGAELSIGSVHLFSEDMTAGRGIVAFAAVIFGAGFVGRVGLGCLLFGFAEALAGLLQIDTSFPSEFVLMVPYLLTIAAVLLSDMLARRRRTGSRLRKPSSTDGGVVEPVVVVGHLTIDDVHTSDGHVHKASVGGAAGYASMGALLAGGDAWVVSRVGADYPVDSLGAVVEDCGRIDVGRVARLEGPSIRNVARYDGAGTRRFEVERFDTLMAQTPDESDLAGLDVRGRWTLVSPATLEQQSRLIDTLGQMGARVALDTEMHYLQGPDALDRLVELTSVVECFLPSKEHLAHLTGCNAEDAEELIDAVAMFRCPLVGVKRGADGVEVVGRNLRTAMHVPAVPNLVAVDPTGAGDAFNGGFLVGLSRGQSLSTAAASGCVAASFVIEAIGVGVPSTYFARERERRISQVVKATHADIQTTASRPTIGRS